MAFHHSQHSGQSDPHRQLLLDTTRCPLHRHRPADEDRRRATPLQNRSTTRGARSSFADTAPSQALRPSHHLGHSPPLAVYGLRQTPAHPSPRQSHLHQEPPNRRRQHRVVIHRKHLRPRGSVTPRSRVRRARRLGAKGVLGSKRGKGGGSGEPTRRET